MEFFIYETHKMPYFIYRRGMVNSKTDVFEWLESREFLSGLDCEISEQGLSFFNGKLIFDNPSKIKQVSKEDFFSRLEETMEREDFDQKAQKIRLITKLNQEYAEVGRNEPVIHKINNSRKRFTRVSLKRMMA